LKNILSRARTAMLEFVASHPHEILLAALAVRFATTLVVGTVGGGHPVVVGVCAAIGLTVDYVALRVTR
jgi:hypothetical protein